MLSSRCHEALVFRSDGHRGRCEAGSVCLSSIHPKHHSDNDVESYFVLGLLFTGSCPKPFTNRVSVSVSLCAPLLVGSSHMGFSGQRRHQACSTSGPLRVLFFCSNPSPPHPLCPPHGSLPSLRSWLCSAFPTILSPTTWSLTALPVPLPWCTYSTQNTLAHTLATLFCSLSPHSNGSPPRWGAWSCSCLDPQPLTQGWSRGLMKC